MPQIGHGSNVGIKVTLDVVGVAWVAVVVVSGPLSISSLCLYSNSLPVISSHRLPVCEKLQSEQGMGEFVVQYAVIRPSAVDWH